MKLKSHWWWDLTALDFARLDMHNIVAVLPVGAVEQHGPHLPVKVDSAISNGIIEEAVRNMAEDFPVLVLPTLSIGKSDEHIDYPGTLTISADTLAQLWFEVAHSAYRAGVRKIVFVNAHGGQPQIMEVVCRRLRIELGMMAVGCAWYSVTEMGDLFNKHELKHGIHAGEVETSMMLYLHGDLVDMVHAKHWESLSVGLEKKGGMLSPEGAVGFGWQAQDLHPSGACGNAAAADTERGEILVKRAATRIVTLLEEVSAFSMEHFANKPDSTAH